MQVVRIMVEGCSEYLPLESLEEFQGDLKYLSEDAGTKLKRSIVKRGFIAPFFIWKDGSRTFILDGHQRKIALTLLQDDGWSIPALPCVEIRGETWDDARLNLMAITSQYGEFSTETVSKWAAELGEEMLDICRLVDTEITLDLGLDFMPVGSEEEGSEVSGGSGGRCCPQCGHEW